MKFENVQRDILDSRERNQLVSAGAGSGKTTVMIEKIADIIINQHQNIDSLLVVTFTVLAAKEMKTRLIDKLNSLLETTQDKSYILSLIDQVKTASIDTIDGFSAKTIRKYFYELEVSPNIEIISDASRDYYLTRSMNKTIDEFSKDMMKANIVLDIFGGGKRNFDTLKELLLTIYYQIINIDDYQYYLDNICSHYLDSEKHEKIILDHIFSHVKSLDKVIRDIYSQCDSNVKVKLDSIIDNISSINNKITLKSNLLALKTININSFSTKDCNVCPTLRDVNLIIKRFNKLKEELKKYGIDEDFDIKNEKSAEILKIFVDLLKSFISNYNTMKQKNDLLDFNDLNRLMLKLLDNKKILNELRDKYKYIFIDEYQDVNPLQDALMMKLISDSTNLFMVGDVKQSIYGFRGSSPEWFLNKYDSYKSNEKNGKAFDMNVNFRSNPKILNFINEIYEKLMTRESSGIDYKLDSMIEPKRDDIIDDKVKIILLKDINTEDIAKGVYSVKNSERKKKAYDAEALWVLKTISELIGTKFYDAGIKEYRTFTYSDIAILSRSEKDDSALNLISLLKENGVPMNTNNKLDITTSESIKLIMSILKCVTGVADDTDYLATFMALTNITIDDIVRFRDKEYSFKENLIANLDNPIIRQGYDAITRIRNAGLTSSNIELIRYILNEERLKFYFLATENGEKELSTLEEFLNKITPLESSLPLNEFIEIIESSIIKGSDFSSIDGENSVTFQTIHKSKGLEYPVVILFGASKMFSYLRENDGINFNIDLGLGINYYNTADRTKSYSLNKYAIKLANMSKGEREELRLLYVALTRAKNKLIIVGKYNDNFFEKQIKKTSYMNAILSCYFDRLTEGKNEFKYCNIEFIDEQVTCSDEYKHSDVRSIERLDTDFIYPNTEKFNVSFKNTVTGLNSKHSQEIGFSTRQWLKPSNQYEQEDRALQGTHYHKALELLNFNTSYQKNSDFEDVDYTKVKKAHEVISKLVKGNVNLKKEAEFMMYVPYSELVDSKTNDKVLVQGVVDLIIERDESIDIVDYKFSRLPIKTLKERYIEQLKLYKKAVELAYKKKVEHMYIYSIETGEVL